LWLWSRERRNAARVLVFCTFVASALALVFLLPFTWSGGGGPPGNRYLLSVYPVLFFLAPPMTTTWAGVAAWMGGALFTAKLLLNPFVSAKYTYLSTERGPTRRLPVELTMVNDLPVMLSTEPIRARIPYGHDPTLLLYFLDQNAFPPDPPGMWVSGGGRADIIVRAADPIDHVVISAESPIDTVLTVSMGAGNVREPLTPGKTVTFSVPAAGVRYVQSYAYLMSVRSSEGFIPHLQDPESKDFRNLGALLRFQAVTKPRQ
jgi:hypothetical protein